MRALVFIAANCYAAIGVVDYPERWCSADDKALHERVRSGARARLHRCWSLFADQFRCRALPGRRLPAMPWTCWRQWCRAGRVRARTCTGRGRRCTPRCCASRPTRSGPCVCAALARGGKLHGP
jgi:hypothetical protein